MNSRDSNLEFLKSLLTGFDEQLASVCALDDFFTGEVVSHGRDLLKDEWALRRNEIFLAMSASNKIVCNNPRESENTTSSALELSENHQDGSPVNNAESEEDTIVAEDEEAVKIEFDASESTQPVNGDNSNATEAQDVRMNINTEAVKKIPNSSKANSSKKDQPSTSNAPVVIDSDSGDSGNFGTRAIELDTQREQKKGTAAEIEAEDIVPVLDDEDEELRKIIELSKQTAREEERRRSQCLTRNKTEAKEKKLKRAVIYDSDDESDGDKPRRKSIRNRKRSALSSDEDDEENCDSERSLEEILKDLDEHGSTSSKNKRQSKKGSPKKKAKRETKKKNVFLDSQAGGKRSPLDLEEDEYDSELDDFIDDSNLPDTQSPIPSEDETPSSSGRLEQVSNEPCTSLASTRNSGTPESRSETVKIESKTIVKKKEELKTEIKVAQQFSPEEDNFQDFEPVLEELQDPDAPPMVGEDLESTGTVEARMALKRVFGYDLYRPRQWRLINGVCKGNDQLGIMATGYGKSICFQMPSILLKKLTICISPLISLMKDQIMKLETFGVKAGLLGSSAKKKDIKRVYELIDSKELRVLYLTPEFSVNNIEKIKDIHRRHAICCFAIDECHCVSQWGHDFRNDYLELHKLRVVDRTIPFLAMTATATPKVRNDIIDNLRLIAPQKVVTSFDRPNLKLFVREKGDEDNLIPDLMATGCLVESEEEIIGGISIDSPDPKKLHFVGCTIIYCRSREATDLLAKTLKRHCGSSKIGAYHAKLPEKTKVATHEGFVNSSIDCVVATIAFGMGVDKGNVRYVIHNEPPGAPESYYQEIGRAGRDGEQSEAHLIYSKKGLGKMAYFARFEEDPDRSNLLRSNARKIETYINTRNCRRLPLLRHFDPDANSSVTATPKCCDNCDRVSTTTDFYDVEEANFATDAAIVFECLAEFSSKPSRTMLQLHIRGSKAKQLKPEMHSKPSWGKGKGKSNDYWRDLIFALMAGDYVAESECYNSMGYGYTVLSVTTKANDWLQRFRRDRVGVELLLPQSELLTGTIPLKDSTSNQPLEPASANKEELPEMSIPGLDHKWLERFMEGPWKKQETQHSEEDKREKRALRDLFTVLAAKNAEKPATLLLTPAKLKEMCLYRPSNEENCAKISGFTRIEADAHADLIDTIKKFCEERNLAMNKKPSTVISDQPNMPRMPNLLHELDGKQKALPTQPEGFERDVYDYLKVGMSVSEIQKELALSGAALAKVITTIVDYGHAVDASAFGVTIDHVKSLEKMIRKNGNVIPALSKIKTIGRININYVPLLVTLTKLRFGMTSNFRQDKKENQERLTLAIKQHTASPSRPVLKNFNSTAS